MLLDKIQSSIINVTLTYKTNSLNTKFNRECHYKFKIRKIKSSIINVISTYNQNSLNTEFDRECHYK